MRHRVLGAEPSPRVEVEVALGAARPLLQLGRQGRKHLQPRVREHTAKAELRRGSRGDEERLRFCGGQAGQLGAVPAGEAIATGRAPNRLHRHAGGAEGLDVAVDRPYRDLEMRRELLRRQLPAHLQEEQERNEPGRPHRAGTYLTEAGMYMS